MSKIMFTQIMCFTKNPNTNNDACDVGEPLRHCFPLSPRLFNFLILLSVQENTQNNGGTPTLCIRKPWRRILAITPI